MVHQTRSSYPVFKPGQNVYRLFGTTDGSNPRSLYPWYGLHDREAQLSRVVYRVECNHYSHALEAYVDIARDKSSYRARARPLALGLE